jgi:hypothetical protein
MLVGLGTPTVGASSKLWQSCIRVFNIKANPCTILAKTGVKAEKTSHTLSGFPGQGM